MPTVKSYFDSHFDAHVYHPDPKVYQSIISKIKKVNLSPTLSVLDIGCGDGTFIKSAIEMGMNAFYIGTDLSSAMIDNAKKKLKNHNVGFLIADGFNLPLKSETRFDIIHISSVLHHLIGNTRTKSINLVKKMLRILMDRLTTDGILVVEEAYYNSYLIPTITSSIIFYALKMMNFFHLDLSSKLIFVVPGLEVNFLYEKQIEKLLRSYGEIQLIKREPYKGLLKKYKLLLLKDYGSVSYLVNA
jgi:SAM-dependent methyltransferase